MYTSTFGLNFGSVHAQSSNLSASPARFHLTFALPRCPTQMAASFNLHDTHHIELYAADATSARDRCATLGVQCSRSFDLCFVTRFEVRQTSALSA